MTQEYTSERSTDAIEADIGRTRQRMDHTLDRLAERLEPRHLLNDLLDFWQSRRSRRGNGQDLAEAVRENARKASETFVHQVRDNPIPALLVGAGVAWLIFDRSRPNDRRIWSEPSEDLYVDEDYGGELEPHDQSQAGKESMSQQVADKVAGATEKVAQAAGTAQRKLRQTREQIRDRARERGQQIRARSSHVRHEMEDRIRQGYERAQQGLREGCLRTRAKYEETADRHPLAAGAACWSIGLLAGFLVPKSQREEEMFGDISDAVRPRVKEASQDLVERGKHVAEAATEAARSEAERQGLTPEHLKEGVKAVGREALETAQRTAEHEGIAPEPQKHESEAVAAKAESTSAGESGKPSL
jgi:hypothetical protein